MTDTERLIEELAALKHDIARHIQIAAEQQQEIERLRVDNAAVHAANAALAIATNRARAEALEEAAQVVDGRAILEESKIGKAVAKDIAAAIRALASKNHE